MLPSMLHVKPTERHGTGNAQASQRRTERMHMRLSMRLAREPTTYCRAQSGRLAASSCRTTAALLHHIMHHPPATLTPLHHPSQGHRQVHTRTKTKSESRLASPICTVTVKALHQRQGAGLLGLLGGFAERASESTSSTLG